MWQKVKDTHILQELPGLDVLQKAAPTVLGCCVSIWIARTVWQRYHLHQKLAMKQKQLKCAKDKVIQQLYKYPLSLNTREYILGLSLMELQRQLQTGDLTAMDVLRAYQSRAMELDERFNCVTEPIMEAEDLARSCDSQTGPKGPLHGIPVSIKENIQLKGYDCTGGMEIYINKPAKEDAVLVQVLKQQGAIPFMRTNIPQTMYSYCCSNPLYGETKNPKDPTRSPGGSSGGEGALLGAGGSILGVGTDIGGSVRIPAQMCGTCALKPTRGRFSCQGQFTVNAGQTLVQGTVGAMARDVDGLTKMTEALLTPQMFALDSTVVPIPFRKEMYESTRPLKIGYYTWDGCVRPVPAAIRAVQCAKTALEKLGHKVVSFSPPKTFSAYLSLYVTCMSGDGARTVKEQLSKDFVGESFRTIYIISSLPKWIQWILVRAVLCMDPVLGQGLSRLAGVSSVYGWFNLAKKIQAYKEEFAKQWRSQGLDAVICPVFPCPAMLTNHIARLTAGGSYCSLYNLLRYSAGSVPVTTVTEADVQETMNPDVYPASTLLEKLVKKSSVGSQGLPVSVQCVCLPYHEEQVLRVMKDLEKGICL